MSISHGRMSPAGMRWEPQKEQSGMGGNQGPLNIGMAAVGRKEAEIPDHNKYWQFPGGSLLFPFILIHILTVFVLGASVFL